MTPTQEYNLQVSVQTAIEELKKITQRLEDCEGRISMLRMDLTDLQEKKNGTQ